MTERKLIDRINEVLTSSHLEKKSLSSRYDLAKISPKAYVVRDNNFSGEVDIYFDKVCYILTLTDPKDRANEFLIFYPQVFIGSLPVRLQQGNVNDFETALKYAKEHLKPKTKEHAFYKKAIALD